MFRTECSAMSLALLLAAGSAQIAFSEEHSIKIDLTKSRVTSSTVSASGFHIKLAATDVVRSSHINRNQGTTAGPRQAATHSAQAGSAVPSVPPLGFYPADLTYLGGATLSDMESNNLYVNKESCGSVRNCWGDPPRFLRDLNESNFIRLTDQYTGTRGSYRVGDSASINVTPATSAFGTNEITQDQIVAIVYSAASQIGTGYGHEYHVFLPAGIDTCFPGDQVCYSPDNPGTFFFCAYHGYVDFNDIGHVLISVEPYQNVNGCQALPPTPNGETADSTYSVLSHELIESITDPDAGDGWIAINSLAVLGDEIGDLCEPVGLQCLTNPYFCDSHITLNEHRYEIQLEYSNKYHACAPGP